MGELERDWQDTIAPKLISDGTRPVTSDKRKDIL